MSKSTSLFGPISPRAADPNRMIFSGWATSTIRRMMSSNTFWSTVRLPSIASPAIIWRLFPHLHRLRQRVYLQPVVLHLAHLVPWEARRVFDGGLELWRVVAVGHDVEPVAVTAVLGHPPFVGGKKNRSRGCTEAFDLDQAQFAGVQVEAGDVIAQVLLVDIVHLTALGTLMLHDDAHGRGLRLRIGTQTPDLRGLALRMRQDE